MKIKNKKKKSYPGSEEVPRVVFCESNRFIRVQAIDDTKKQTLLFHSTEKLNKDNKSFSRKNKTYACSLAKIFVEDLKNKGYKKIIFDRNGKQYHGKIKMFCDIMRNEGVLF